MTALSPREDPPPLRSTSDKPRRTRSTFEVKSVARGYTMRAGAETRERLHKGVIFKRTPRPGKAVTNASTVHVREEEGDDAPDDA